MKIEKYICDCEEGKDLKCPYCNYDMEVKLHKSLIAQEESTKPHQHMKKVCNRCGTVIWSYQMYVGRGYRAVECEDCKHMMFQHTISGCVDCKCEINGVEL